MRRLKTIDELYDEVKDYGLVITNDVALETALNLRVDSPRVGPLAMTPMHIAQHIGVEVLGHEPISDLDLIKSVSKDAGCNYKRAFGEIQNIRKIRRYKKEVVYHIRSRKGKEILREFNQYPTVEKVLDGLNVDEPAPEYVQAVKRLYGIDGGVAFIGCTEPGERNPDTWLFDELEKTTVPYDPVVIDMFTDECWNIDTIHVVGNDRQLAENAADLIDVGDADQYAIVFNAGDPIADAVRTSLYRRNIPFINTLNVSDLNQVREYITFIDLALRYDTLHVYNVREIFACFNGFFDSQKLGNNLLDKLSDSDFKKRGLVLRDLMRSIQKDALSFGKVRDTLYDGRGRDLGRITTILDELEMESTNVNLSSLEILRFTIENIPIPHNEQIPDNETQGVLLVDCMNSVFIDRPVIIYLNLDQSWVPPQVDRDLQVDDESKKDAIRLEALLQQGQKRVYLVNSSSEGKPSRPALTFDTMLDQPCPDFSKVCTNLIYGGWVQSDGGSTIAIERTEEEDFNKLFSKSTFNEFVKCPRRYLYNRMIAEDDNEKGKVGNYIHNFNELYFSYPDIDDKDIDLIVSTIVDMLSGLSSSLKKDIDESIIRNNVKTFRSYLDSIITEASPSSMAAYSDKHDNPLVIELNDPRFSEYNVCCERNLKFEDMKIDGKIDLQFISSTGEDNNRIIDYKTGTPPSSSEIVSGMDIDSITSSSEFQPLIYLLLAETLDAPARIFELFYSKGEGKSIKIKPIKDDLDAYLITDKFAKQYNDRLKGDLRDHDIGLKIVQIIDAKGMLNASSFNDLDSLLPDIVEMFDTYRISDSVDTATTALSHLKNMVVHGMIILKDSNILVPNDTMGRFRTFILQKYDELKAGRISTLPPRPESGVKCTKCSYFQFCTMCPQSSVSDSDGGDADE